MDTFTPEKLFALFEEFVTQAQTDSQETKKYKQKIAGFEIGAGFGQGKPSRVPWFGFFAEGQTAKCGIYPVCLYYKGDDLFVVAYGVSEETPPKIQWGRQVQEKKIVFNELEKRGISSAYKNTKNRTRVMYGDSFVKACFEKVSSIKNTNNPVFEDIYINISEILDEYKNDLSNIHLVRSAPNIIIRQNEYKLNIVDQLEINHDELIQMKNIFLDTFKNFESFQSSEEYISSERQYKDDLRNIFNTELLPLLEDDNIDSAQRIPSTLDKILRAKLPTTRTNQNIIHWLSWSYLQDIDVDTAKTVGLLFRSLLDESIDLQVRLDSFEEKYIALLDEKSPPRTGKRSWQGILRPITSFILAFAFPEKYIFVRTEVIRRASERLLGENICADYTSRKNTLGQEYTRIMVMSKAVRDALVSWEPQDFIDIQSFLWVGTQENNTGYTPIPKDVVLTAPIKISPETPRDQSTTVENFFSSYAEPDFTTIKSNIQKSGLMLDDRTLRRYHLSLKNRKFVILAGVSGTGKTWLAEEYARAVGAEYLNVPVAPNWTSNEDLLGFHNPVLNSYQSTDFTLFLERACAAQQQADVHKVIPHPFHLILDEMNLARVEHYFARFLATMELRQRQAAPSLFLGPDKELFLPMNLYFIGTVNVDETTHGFADKVFDRAQLIELPLNRDLIAAHLKEKEYAVPLMAIWDALIDVAPFAFRVLDDIIAYIETANTLGTPWVEALDEMLVQKVLPRIRGNDSRLVKIFEDIDTIATEYGLSFVTEKVTHMRTSYYEHGFASFFR